MHTSIWMTGLLVAGTAVLAGCQSGESRPDLTASDIPLAARADTGRWYSGDQLAEGRALFAEHCAACHGAGAEGTATWKQLDDSGHYPPPPLNGSAHAWHHPLAVLHQVITDGGEPLGGVMPAWGDKLTDRQRFNVIAAFQDHWSDDVYSRWLERERASRREGS